MPDAHDGQRGRLLLRVNLLGVRIFQDATFFFFFFFFSGCLSIERLLLPPVHIKAVFIETSQLCEILS